MAYDDRGPRGWMPAQRKHHGTLSRGSSVDIDDERWSRSGSRMFNFTVPVNGVRAGWRVRLRTTGSRCILATELPTSRQRTRWDLTLRALCCYRLIEPGSEWRIHRHWYETTAMPDLLGSGFELVEIHKLYRASISSLYTSGRF